MNPIHFLCVLFPGWILSTSSKRLSVLYICFNSPQYLVKDWTHQEFSILRGWFCFSLETKSTGEQKLHPCRKELLPDTVGRRLRGFQWVQRAGDAADRLTMKEASEKQPRLPSQTQSLSLGDTSPHLRLCIKKMLEFISNLPFSPDMFDPASFLFSWPFLSLPTLAF